MDGTELRARRECLGLTQAGLAARLGLTATFISMMERRTKPVAPRTAFAIAALEHESIADPGPLDDRPLESHDPLERLVEQALRKARVPYETDRDGGNRARLDFYLPEQGVAIEVKRMHSPRIAEQMARHDQVIALQGLQAVKLFCLAVEGGRLSELAAVPED